MSCGYRSALHPMGAVTVANSMSILTFLRWCLGGWMPKYWFSLSPPTTFAALGGNTEMRTPNHYPCAYLLILRDPFYTKWSRCVKKPTTFRKNNDKLALPNGIQGRENFSVLPQSGSPTICVVNLPCTWRFLQDILYAFGAFNIKLVNNNVRLILWQCFGNRFRFPPFAIHILHPP